MAVTPDRPARNLQLAGLMLSYAASSLEILGALAVGLAGVAILRRDGLESVAPRATPA